MLRAMPTSLRLLSARTSQCTRTCVSTDVRAGLARCSGYPHELRHGRAQSHKVHILQTGTHAVPQLVPGLSCSLTGGRSGHCCALQPAWCLLLPSPTDRLHHHTTCGKSQAQATAWEAGRSRSLCSRSQQVAVSSGALRRSDLPMTNHWTSLARTPWQHALSVTWCSCLPHVTSNRCSPVQLPEVTGLQNRAQHLLAGPEAHLPRHADLEVWQFAFARGWAVVG